MSALSYMQRRVSGTYEFRRRLPEALAGKPASAQMREAFPDLINPKSGCFKRELVRSLRTKDVREAKRLDHREALKADALFDNAVQAHLSGGTTSQLSDADIRTIEADVLSELLSSDEAEREEGDDRRHLQTPAERAQWKLLEPAIPVVAADEASLLPPPPMSSVKGMAIDHFHAYGDQLSELEDEYREAWARRDPSIVRAETRDALKRKGIRLDQSSPDFRRAGLSVLQAHVKAFDAMLARQRGEIVPTPQPAGDWGPKLSEAFETWRQGGAAKGAKKPKAKTVIEAEQAVRYFRELHGDLRLGEITREKARQFRDAIAKVPRSLPHKLRSLPLPRLLEQDLSGYQPRNATTVNKLLTLPGAIISQAERDGFLDKVPGFVNAFGKGIRFAVREGEPSRVLFGKVDLQAIFTSPVYSNGLRPVGGGGEAAFWLPLIGLLSGMRLDEIAQLRICDLKQDEETSRWYFNVDRSGGRSTKTASSIRCVPVHRELTRVGLLKYRQSLIDGGAAPKDSLWPDVKAEGERQLSSAWSKWFGRYLRNKCGITDSAKVFHSFRHTFKRMTRDAELPEELHDALTGHAGNGGAGRTYGRGVSLKPLVRAIDKVRCPVDLELRWKPAKLPAAKQ